MSPSTAAEKHPARQRRDESAPRRASAGPQFAQVMLLYPRLWQFWAMLVPFLVVIVGSHLYSSNALRIWRELFGEITLIYIALISTCIAVFLRIQLDDWRSKLVPGFRFPHLTVGAILMAIVTIGVPLLVHRPLGASADGFVAIAIAASAMAAWITYEPVLMVVWPFVQTGSGQRVYNACADLLAGRYPMLALGTIALGVAAIGLLWKCLATVVGEGATLPRNNGIDLHFRQSMTGQRSWTFGPISTGMIRLTERIHERLSQYRRSNGTVRATTAWGRISHRQIPAMFHGNAGTWGIIIGLLIVGILRLAKHIVPSPEDTAKGAMLLIFYPALTAVIFPGIAWPSQWPYFAMESLRPASRRGFVREMGVAYAAELVKFWALSTVISIAGAALLFPQQFSDRAGFIAAQLAFSGASLILTFGLAIWSARWRNALMSVGCVMLTVTLSIIPIAGLSESRQLNVPCVAGGFLAFIVVGTIFALDGYRRWCRTELG